MERRKNRVLLCLCHLSGNEQKFIQEALDSNWVVPLGPNVNGFEKDLEEFVNSSVNTKLTKRVVALSSGTAAVHLALTACGVGPGDEVCVQSFTFCASSHPITYLGAKPIFIDSEKETWNMSPELLEEAIIDRIAKTGKKPKAIVPVALYGMPYKIDRIMEIANRYDIPVIEDAAEGFGSKFNGQVLGTLGKGETAAFRRRADPHRSAVPAQGPPAAASSAVIIDRRRKKSIAPPLPRILRFLPLRRSAERSIIFRRMQRHA